MSGASWIPFYPSDWLNGTAGMPLDEIGIYIQITMLLYDSDNAIPLDRVEHPVTGKVQGYDYRTLAQRFGIRRDRCARLVASLLKRQKLSIQAGYLTSNRVARELAKRAQKSNRTRVSAQRRWSYRAENIIKIKR